MQGHLDLAKWLRCRFQPWSLLKAWVRIPAFVLVRQSKRATPKNAPGNETVKPEKEYESRLVCYTYSMIKQSE